MPFTVLVMLFFSVLITFTSHANELDFKQISDFEYGMVVSDSSVDAILYKEEGWSSIVTCIPEPNQSCWLKLALPSDNQSYEHLVWKSLSSRTGELFFVDQDGKVVGNFLFEYYRSLRLNKNFEYSSVLVKFPRGKTVNASALFSKEHQLKQSLVMKDGVILALFLLSSAISLVYVYFAWPIKRSKTLFMTCYIVLFSMFYIYKFGFLWDGYDDKGTYVINFFRSDYWFVSYSLSLVCVYLMLVFSSCDRINTKHLLICSSFVFLQFFSVYINFDVIVGFLISTILAAVVIAFCLISKEVNNKVQIIISYLSCFIMSVVVLESSMTISFIPEYYYLIQALFYLSHASFVLACVYDLGELRVINLGDYKKLLSNSDKDFMTGLYNRKSIEYKKVIDCSRCYYYIDANQLKFLNDSQGHHVGDRMIINLAMRFKKIAAQGIGKAYRVGGDEFVLICQTSVSKELLEYLLEQNLTQETENALSFSFGRYRSGPNESVEDCIYKAEYCCRKAKSNNESYQDWQQQDGVMLYSLPNLRVEAVELLNSDRLLCFAQKIHSLKGVASSYELLCRLKMEDEEGREKIVSAGELLDVVASHGLEKELDSRMLTYAISLLEHYSTIQLSLNFSVKTIFDMSVIDRLCHLPPYIRSRLCVEVTELVFYRADEKFRKIVERLQHHQIIVALDDFGSGYSSYSILSEGCFDTIKLDGSLVENINGSDFKKKMVHSLVELAEMSQTKVVAERVETIEELRMLEALGIDFIQGFYIHKPTLAIEIFDNMAKEARESEKAERNLICGLTS
ncbi:GGDEF domain-containing protein [Vibrio sp. 10N.261.49.A5]|uniref:Diguanylate phosphodiesterase n=1 Tax=Vibrio tasmaniensis 1F-267 TaxID=1191324 RepID=A0ABX3B6N4_9VIBR|nr:GGDEF domain-containing phosphodiesterase [Vibrio tasmaniensis]OEF47175.1 diguanylate phosphodiesterase [Vibrio tasmaniensis 1F-267]